MAKSGSFKDKVRAAAGKEKSGGGGFGYLNLPKGMKTFSPEPGGKHTLDFIPYEVTDKHHMDREAGIVPGELWYKKPFKVHRNIGVNQDSVVCPTTFGKPCPICEYAKRRKDEGAEKGELDALRPSRRNLYAVIPIGEKKHEETIHIWDSSQFLFQDLLNDELDENDDYLVFPDIEEGLSLKVRFDKTTFGSSKPFATASRIDFVDRKDGYDDSILEEVPNLDEILKVLPYSELDALFLGADLADDDKDDEDTPRRKSHKEEERKPAKSAKKQEDDDDDDDDDTSTSTSKKTPPAKKSKPKLTWEELVDMEDDELSEVAESHSIDLDEEEDTHYHRRQIAEELGIEIPKKKEKEAPTRTRTSKPETKSKPTKKQEEDDDDDDDDEEKETPKPKVKGKDACVACQGTGVNSRGKKCPICDGTGRRPSDKAEKGGCPYGHKFGKDCDQFDECDSCEKWDECTDAK